MIKKYSNVPREYAQLYSLDDILLNDISPNINRIDLGLSSSY